MLLQGNAPPMFQSILTGQNALVGGAGEALGCPSGANLVRLTNPEGGPVVYYGASGVDNTTGVPLPAGASILIFCANIYVYASSNTTVAWEAYF